MVKKDYNWANGVELEDHTKCKLKILRDYYSQYLATRCQLPQQQKFRLAVIDGFAGGGRYECGSAGSPIVFIEETRNAVNAINLQRISQGFGTIQIECFLLFNDATPGVIDILRSNVAPLLAEIRENTPELHIRVEYLTISFEAAYPTIRKYMHQGRYRNVLFNLDQCGHTKVERKTLLDIMQSYSSAEVFYTFAIQTLLTYLQKSDPNILAAQLASVGLSTSELQSLEGAMNSKRWLGVAERLVFDAFKVCSTFVSPFSINNPNGWRYWLIHFANSFRARQVYNNILHQNSSTQAHFGRSGLNMLSYNPKHDDGNLYLFDVSGRGTAKKELLDDIPRLISESGDVIGITEFYESIYNMTPAHMDDIHSAIMENPDTKVITQAGGERRKANTIGVGDLIKLRRQKSFFPMF